MKLPGIEFDFEAIGGRAFVLAVGCGLMTSFLRFTEHLDNGSYTAIIIATVGAYIAANAVEKHGQIKADTAIATANIAAAAGNTAPAPLGST